MWVALLLENQVSHSSCASLGSLRTTLTWALISTNFIGKGKSFINLSWLIWIFLKMLMRGFVNSQYNFLLMSRINDVKLRTTSQMQHYINYSSCLNGIDYQNRRFFNLKNYKKARWQDRVKMW